jgi:hypothetical protein
MATAKLDWHYPHEFNGGEKECSELLLDLRLYFDPLEPGVRVCIIAHDPGAWFDRPAYRRVTSPHLIEKVHPYKSGFIDDE